MARRRRPTDSNPHPVRLWKYLLVAVPLAALGLVLIGVAVRDVALWQRAKRWIERPATILDVFLHPGGRRSGPSVEARYQYEVDAKTYENDRVAIFSGNGLSDFESALARDLEDSKRTGIPVPCFVNPADPREAVLHRDLRPTLLGIQLLLGIVPCGIAVAVIRSYRFKR
jgi:hypothetical protein